MEKPVISDVVNGSEDQHSRWRVAAVVCGGLVGISAVPFGLRWSHLTGQDPNAVAWLVIFWTVPALSVPLVDWRLCANALHSRRFAPILIGLVGIGELAWMSGTRSTDGLNSVSLFAVPILLTISIFFVTKRQGWWVLVLIPVALSIFLLG
jgi:hypothetical protein